MTNHASGDRNIAALKESAPPPRSKVKFRISLSLIFKLFISFTYVHIHIHIRLPRAENIRLPKSRSL